jgi:hypothetical protein
MMSRYGHLIFSKVNPERSHFAIIFILIQITFLKAETLGPCCLVRASTAPTRRPALTIG